MSPVFTEISLVVVLAAACGLFAHLLRQPTILGYLLAGLVVGPLGYLHFDNVEVLHGFAEIGIALLLFMIGLELNVAELKHMGKPALFTGIGQIVFTTAIGFFILKTIGLANITAGYMAVALAFSSTIVVVKLLHEKHDLDSLYGRIVVGFLLVQDVVAIFILVFISGMASSTEVSGSAGQFGILLLKGVLLVGGVLYAGRKYFPKILDKIGHSQELLFIFSIAWGLGFATFVSSEAVGYSLEMGGLLAGIALANASEHFQISGKIRPLRDFFILIFFVVLGSEMVLANIGEIILPAILLSLFVLVGNPIIVMIIMSLLGYRPRTSFLASLTVAQISEFSLIVVILGERVGHISAQDVSLVTLVAVITMVVSSYMIWHGNRLYDRIKHRLGFLEVRKRSAEDIGTVENIENHIVLIGAHRTGATIINTLQEIKANYLVVDFNPMVVKKLQHKKIPVIYGDIIDDEIQERAGLNNARLIISTIPDMHDAMSLVKFVREHNAQAKIIVTADTDWQGLRLYKAGADYVLLPHFLGGRQLASIIRQDSEQGFEHLHQYKLRDMRLIKEDLI